MYGPADELTCASHLPTTGRTILRSLTATALSTLLAFNIEPRHKT